MGEEIWKYVNDPSRFLGLINVNPGNVLYGSALGNHVVILNKWEDAEELLENRSVKYSDRPWIPMIEKYVYHQLLNPEFIVFSIAWDGPTTLHF